MQTKISNLVAIVTEWYTCKKLAPKTLTGRTQTDMQTYTEQTLYTSTSLKRGYKNKRIKSLKYCIFATLLAILPNRAIYLSFNKMTLMHKSHVGQNPSFISQKCKTSHVDSTPAKSQLLKLTNVDLNTFKK